VPEALADLAPGHSYRFLPKQLNQDLLYFKKFLLSLWGQKPWTLSVLPILLRLIVVRRG
jgi:hypothetical protein